MKGCWVEISGDTLVKVQVGTPSTQKHIQDYLPSFCFGDFYTRDGLDLKTQEMLSLCIVSALIGAED